MALDRRQDLARDVDDEFEFHLTMRAAELEAEGLSPDAARAEAEREFGDLEEARRYCRRQDDNRGRFERWRRRLRNLPLALRHSVRALRGAPAISTAAIVCLALGIGAATAVFSAVHTALLRPLPFVEPERLVTVFRTTPQFDTGPFSPRVYLALADDSRQLAGYGAMTGMAGLFQGTDRADHVQIGRVSGTLFPLLGVRPQLGRLFTPEDDDETQPPVVVLTDEFWRDRFGGAPAIVGESVRLDGVSRTVVGVLPRNFRVVHGGFTITADLYVPMRFSEEQRHDGSNFLLTMGRLAPGATVETVDAELKALMNGVVERFPTLRGEQVRVVPMHRQDIAAVRTPLLLLLGAVGCVLLIACANTAALLLARGLERQREIAVRTALGAGRGAVVSQVLLETTLLGVVGLVLGVGLAWVGVRTIGATAASRMPQLTGLTMDLRVLGVAVAAAAIVTLLCGVAPAWRAATTNPQDALRQGSGRTGGRRQHRFLRGLVAAEVAVSLVVLLGAGLIVRGFLDLTGRDPGFDPGPLLTMQVTLDPDRYRDRPTYTTFLLPALDAVRRVPGVVEAGAINLLPYQTWGWNFNVQYEGRPADDPTRSPLIEARSITPSYLATLGIPLIRGRLFSDADVDSTGRALPYVVINQAAVARDFPDEDPIGKRFRSGGPDEWATIIGVVGDIRNFGPVSAPRPEVLFSYARGGSLGYPIIARVAGGNPTSVAQAVAAALRSVDPGIAVNAVRPMAEIIAGSVGRSRFLVSLWAVFAAVAVLLAAAGLYGTMSYAAAQRTREIGIRTALGSSTRRTMTLILRQGVAVLAVGVGVGLAAGVLVTRLLTSMLYGVSPLDPITWVLGGVVLSVVGVSAALLPALRAARVDPMVAIRAE